MALQRDIRDAQLTVKTESISVKPKPIVLHLNSPGGWPTYGMSLVNTLTEIHVPFAVVVDGYACSAITPILVAAPYRVMNDYALVLIHEGFSSIYGKTSEVKFYSKYYEVIDEQYLKVYKENTDIPEDMLKVLSSRDKFLGGNDCIALNIVDRLLKVDYSKSKKTQDAYYSRNKEYDFTKNTLLWKTNFNHIYGVHKDVLPVVKNLVEFSSSELSDNVKPIIFHVNQLSVDIYRLNDIAAFFIALHMQQVPTISVIDNDVDLINALPYFTCHKRYMYEDVTVLVHLVYFHSEARSLYYQDVIENFELFKSIILNLLDKYHKIPKTVLKGLFDTRVMLTAQECLEYGLIDEIIKPVKHGRNLIGCKFKDCNKIKQKLKKT